MCLGAVEVPNRGVLDISKHLPLPPQPTKEVIQPPQDAEASVNELLVQAVSASIAAPNRAVKRRVRQRFHKKLGAICTKEEFDEAVERFKVLEQRATAAPGGRRRGERGNGAANSSRAVPSIPAATSNNTPAPAVTAAPRAPVNPTPTQTIMVPVFYQVQPVMQKPAPTPQCTPQARPASLMPVAVAFAQPAVTSHVCAVQDVRKLHEQVQIEEESVKVSTADSTEQKATESDDNDELSSLSSEESFRRALSALPELAEPLPVERTFIQFSTRAFIHRRRSRSV